MKRPENSNFLSNSTSNNRKQTLNYMLPARDSLPLEDAEIDWQSRARHCMKTQDTRK